MSSKERIQTPKAPQAIGPYSQAIRCGDFIFASGQIPLVPTTGEVVQGSIKDQAEQVLQNIRAICEACGKTLADVVKTTIFLKDMNHFTDVNEVYGKHFSEPYPARSTVQVARLPKDVGVEIEVIVKV